MTKPAGLECIQKVLGRSHQRVERSGGDWVLRVDKRERHSPLGASIPRKRGKEFWQVADGGKEEGRGQFSLMAESRR